MQRYYPSLQAIEQQSRQLDDASCIHCQRTQQLVSHGFIYKKQTGSAPAAVGKRVWCSNRNRRTGCGRTMRLYLDSTVRHLHYTGQQVVAFLLALMAGMTVQCAYCQATGATEARHAWRWLHRLATQLSSYRSLLHQPLLQGDSPILANRPVRLRLLASTFLWLLQRFGMPLCTNYQQQLQRSFL